MRRGPGPLHPDRERPARRAGVPAHGDRILGARGGRRSGWSRCSGVPPKLLRDGEGWATEETGRLGTHNSTHVDAPWHYNSHIRGWGAQTIDELPLEWFLRGGESWWTRPTRATAIPLTWRIWRPGWATSPPHARAARHRACAHRPRCVVRASSDYLARGPAVTAAATLWLFEHGVRVMGRRVGVGRPAALPGRGGQAGRRSGRVRGRAPGGPAVLADRAPREPEQAPPDRVPGRLLPAQNRGRERGAGAGLVGILES